MQWLSAKKGNVVGHLPKGKTGKFAILSEVEMLCACKVKVTGKTLEMIRN